MPMIPRVTIIEGDELTQQVYIFWLDEYTMRLVLDEYRNECRPSRRHNWRIVNRWTRVNRRDSTIHREDIHLSESVRQAAWDTFTSKITVEE